MIFATGGKNVRKVAIRRGAGVVDRDGLENRLRGNAYEGSNPSLSAFLMACVA
jgi:hypothetical protein